MGATSFKDLVHHISGIKREERLGTFLMFLWFFITICAYYIIRPVRSSLFLTSFSPSALPWIYMGTAVAAGAAVYVWGKCADFPRRNLIGGTLVLFALNLFAWWWVAGQAQAARLAGTGGWGWTSPAFYIWTDIFSSMSVTMFWMYANDICPPATAKRIFGVIGAAGPAGGIAGAWLTGLLVLRLGTVNMILVAAGVNLAAMACFLVLENLSAGRAADRPLTVKTKQKADLSKISDVMRQIFSSRFLLLLTIVVCMERMVPDFVDYAFQTIGKAAYPDQDAFTHFFACFETWRNIGALAASLFITGAFLQLAGVGSALMSVPMTILAFGIMFALMPVLSAVVLLKGFEEGQRHSWFKAGKELLYTTTNHDTIYRVKGYIEMFFYRLSRGAAGFTIFLVVALAGSNTAMVMIAALPLALCWLYCARELGKEYQKREATAAQRPVSVPKP